MTPGPLRPIPLSPPLVSPPISEKDTEVTPLLDGLLVPQGLGGPTPALHVSLARAVGGSTVSLVTVPSLGPDACPPQRLASNSGPGTRAESSRSLISRPLYRWGN